MSPRSRNPSVLADKYLLQSPEGSTHLRRWVVSGYLSYTLANWNRRDLLHWDPVCLRNGSHSLSVLDRWKRSSGGRLNEAIFNVDQDPLVCRCQMNWNELTEPRMGISLKRLLTAIYPSISHSLTRTWPTYKKSRYLAFPMYFSRANVLELGKHRLLVQRQYAWIEGWGHSRALFRMASLL